MLNANRSWLVALGFTANMTAFVVAMAQVDSLRHDALEFEAPVSAEAVISPLAVHDGIRPRYVVDSLPARGVLGG